MTGRDHSREAKEMIPTQVQRVVIIWTGKVSFLEYARLLEEQKKREEGRKGYGV